MQEEYMEINRIKEEFIEWINPSVIADVLAEELAEEDQPVNFDNMKKLWLLMLEDLWDLARARIHRFSSSPNG